MNLRTLKKYVTGCFVRLSPNEAASLRLPKASIGVIGIGPVAVLFNLPKVLVKPEPTPPPTISLDEINFRARRMGI